MCMGSDQLHAQAHWASNLLANFVDYKICFVPPRNMFIVRKRHDLALIVFFVISSSILLVGFDYFFNTRFHFFHYVVIL
jgi:hypothetical protein